MRQLYKVNLTPPQPNIAVVDSNGILSRYWAAFFQGLYDNARTVQSAAQTWNTYSPAVTGESPMTVAGLVVNLAESQQFFATESINLDVSFTLGGTAGPAVDVALPVAAVSTSGVFNCAITDTATVQGVARINSGVIKVTRYDGANWTLGASKRIRISGSYRVASI